VQREALEVDRRHRLRRDDLSGGAGRQQVGAAEPVATVHFEGLALVLWWSRIRMLFAFSAISSNTGRL
jgi:hypothetical protein